jgi:RNA polymerase sigma-70 factor (ECF subfamily)
MLVPDIGSLQAGNGSMWDTAFLWLWPIAWSAAKRRLADSPAEDVEDVAIVAIREAAKKVQKDEVGSFEELKALTGIIASRRALDHLRSKRAKQRGGSATESIEEEGEVPSPGPSLLEQVDAQELARVLVDLAGHLPRNQRDLLLAYYLEGRKQSELAKSLGIPLGTVGVTLSRALKAMRKELAAHPKLLKEVSEALR